METSLISNLIMKILLYKRKSKYNYHRLLNLKEGLNINLKDNLTIK